MAASSGLPEPEPVPTIPVERQLPEADGRFTGLKVLVAGATGGVGKAVVQQLAAQGVAVRALVRDGVKANSMLPPASQGVEIVEADVYKFSTVAKAMAGCNAVICATGPTDRLNPLGPFTIDCEGTKNLVAAAQQQAASPSGAAGSGPTYYIAADEVQWDYSPGGVNLCSGTPFTDEPALWTKEGVGSIYTKALYQQYTDDTFETVQPKPDSEKHTGMLGPVLRASVGQVLTVVFKNNLDFPVNLEPAGVQPVLDSADADAAAELSPAVEPGETVTYRWTVPDSMGPKEFEPSAKLWLYRSSVDMPSDVNAGLLGPLLVSKDPEVNTGDVAAGQERDIITILQVIDENSSPYLERNLANRTAADLGLSDEELEEANLKHGINGYLYCTLPGINMTQGEKVRWHMASIGTETDMHNLHLHGNTFLNNGHRADHMNMIPGTARSVQFDPANAGFWLIHCHVADHITAGMKAMYQVNKRDDLETLSTVNPTGTVRRYYIAADEVQWDYVPRGGDYCSGELQDFTPDQEVFTTPTDISPGNILTKARYVEYTDDTFTTPKPRSPADEYLGLLGPIIRAEVGDTIEVVFKNNARFPTTIHPHGVAYLKSAEGSPYFDGTMGADKEDDAVQPNTTFTYVWQVAETSAPGPADPSTVVYMYHSHTNEVADVYAGLVGAIVIGRNGEVKEDLTGADVDREVVLLFIVYNEVASLYADVMANSMGFDDIGAWEEEAEAATAQQAAIDQQAAIQEEEEQKLADGSTGATATAGRRLSRRLFQEEEEDVEEEEEEVSGEGYDEPMLKHAINGYLYCNMPDLTFTQGERVRFHILALGTEVDMHTPNFAGQSLQIDNQRKGALGVMPGAMHSVDVAMVNPGIATVTCRVADHIAAGMTSLVKVLPSEEAEAELEAAAAEAPVQRYFIAAEEVEWNYAPLGLDGCTGEEFSPDAEIFVKRTDAWIGSNFTKAQYRQYTDDTFTTLVPQPATQGILGPTIVAEVGDNVEIVFLNRLDMEANLALDGGLEMVQGGDGASNSSVPGPVQPGEQATYRYYVPASAGPASDDVDTVAYTYTSSVDLVAHPYGGLVGVLVVGAPGTFTGEDGNRTSVPQGVDSMVPLLFVVINEAESPYLSQNMEAAGLGVEATFDGDWGESLLKHAINGYLYCNMPGFEAPRGSTMRLLLVGMGSEVDMHSPIFTGQVLEGKSTAYQTAELMPTVSYSVDVTLEQAGTWPVYCQVHDHLLAGMQANLVVA